MAKHLYETLGVSKDASPDEIRRAYRQAALKTHPDKQRHDSTEKEKDRARDQFQKVNNAYEVLSDEEKRRIYDRYGEFPPPEVQQDPYADYADHHRHRHRPHAHSHRRGTEDLFDDPFFSQPFGASASRSRPRDNGFYGFTDPFALFDQMFGDMRRQFDDPVFGDPFPSAGPFGRSPFSQGSLFDTMMGGGPGFRMLPRANSMFEQTGVPHQGQAMSFQSTSRGVLTRGPDGNPQWASQSKITRTVNGVTESVWKRTDSNGNEHVTYSYPDGRERYLINGAEQPSGARGDHSLPPPPPYPGPPAPLNTSYRPIDRGSGRQDMDYTPSYSPAGTGPYAQPTNKQRYEYERDREYRHGHRDRKHRYSHDNNEAYGQHDPHKKRWWKGEW